MTAMMPRRGLSQTSTCCMEGIRMRTYRVIAGLVMVAVVDTAWYLFRPELLFVNRAVNEALPEATAMATPAPATPHIILSAGRFHSVAHESTGVATIHQFPDGRRIVRLTEIETFNGPDVRVYLVAADDARDNETVTRAGFVDLGPLKGNRGDQNYEVPQGLDYEVPQGLDIDQYGAVAIWCRRFSVNFATAPLQPEQKNLEAAAH